MKYNIEITTLEANDLNRIFKKLDESNNFIAELEIKLFKYENGNIYQNMTKALLMGNTISIIDLLADAEDENNYEQKGYGFNCISSEYEGKSKNHNGCVRYNLNYYNIIQNINHTQEGAKLIYEFLNGNDDVNVEDMFSYITFGIVHGN